MLLKSILTADQVQRLIADVSAQGYDSNLTSQANAAGVTRSGLQKVRFTLGVANSFARGARRAASGRHMPKASWQAHRDVMQALFGIDPAAELVTAMATYKGRADFLARFEQTGDVNVGSRMHPVAIRDLEV